MTWKIPANYPSLESFSADQRTKLTGNNNANYIHLLIRAITPSRNESFSRGTVERKDTSRAWNGEGRLYDIFACRVSLCDQNGLATRRVVSCLNSIRGPSWLACYIGQLFVWKRARWSPPPPSRIFTIIRSRAISLTERTFVKIVQR